MASETSGQTGVCPLNFGALLTPDRGFTSGVLRYMLNEQDTRTLSYPPFTSLVAFDHNYYYVKRGSCVVWADLRLNM